MKFKVRHEKEGSSLPMPEKCYIEALFSLVIEEARKWQVIDRRDAIDFKWSVEPIVVGVPIHAIVEGSVYTDLLSLSSLFLSFFLFLSPPLKSNVLASTPTLSRHPARSWRRNLSRGAGHHAQTDGAFPPIEPIVPTCFFVASLHQIALKHTTSLRTIAITVDSSGCLLVRYSSFIRSADDLPSPILLWETTTLTTAE